MHIGCYSLVESDVVVVGYRTNLSYVDSRELLVSVAGETQA